MKLMPFILLLILSSCGLQTEMTTFQIKTAESTNQGAPFYVLFKETDLPHFLSDDYKKIANQRMLSTDGPDYLNSAFFVPGETQTIAIEHPDNKSIGVYFIFKERGEEWKYLAQEGGKVKIITEEDGIKAVTSF